MLVFTLVTQLLIAQAPAAPVSVAAPDLSVIELERNRAAFYTEHLANQLIRSGLKVITSKQIATLLGMERQKVLLGCSDEASNCMAELAAALGADGVLSGSVARIGRSYQINVSIISSRDGTSLSIQSARVKSEEEVLDALGRMAPKIHADLIRRLRPRQAAALEAASSSEELAAVDTATEVAAAPEPEIHRPLRPLAWIPAAAGGVFAAGGAVLLLQAQGAMTALDPNGEGTVSLADAEAIRSRGVTFRDLGYVAAGIGVAGLAAAGVMYFLPGDAPPHVEVGAAFTGSTGLVQVGGSF